MKTLNNIKFSKNKVDILGEEYSLLFSDSSKDKILKTAKGYCDVYSKRIIIGYIENPDYQTTTDYLNYYNSVLRHELAHAFLYESGDNYEEYNQEEMCNWLAVIAPKMMNIYEQCKIINKKKVWYEK